MKSLTEFIKPTDLSKRQAGYHTRGLIGGLMGFIYWSLLFVYFLVIKAPQPLIIAGIAAVASFLLYLFLWHRRKYTIGWIIGYFNLYLLVSFLTIQLGWSLGFQFVLLSGIIFSEAGMETIHKFASYIQVVTVIVFAALGFLTYGVQVDNPLPEGHGIVLFMINLVSPLLGPVLTQRSYLINAAKLEVQLEKSHEENEKLLHNIIEAGRKNEELLHSILPVEVARELQETGSVQPARFDDVTIFFSDFQGFTNIVATIPTKKLISELNEIFCVFDDIMDSEGIEKIQTVGDAYLAACGLPLAVDNHAERCVRAAKKILEFLNRRNETHAIKWKVRIGLHSGPISAGVTGKKKFAYDIFGDTINTASRIESNGKEGKINVSAYTYDLIKNEFDCEYRGKINAKGKGELDMYFVV